MSLECNLSISFVAGFGGLSGEILFIAVSDLQII